MRLINDDWFERSKSGQPIVFQSSRVDNISDKKQVCEWSEHALNRLQNGSPKRTEKDGWMDGRVKNLSSG